jgi:hypothetical protein
MYYIYCQRIYIYILPMIVNVYIYIYYSMPWYPCVHINLTLFVWITTKKRNNRFWTTTKAAYSPPSQVVQSLQSIVSRETDPLSSSVISVTKVPRVLLNKSPYGSMATFWEAPRHPPYHSLNTSWEGTWIHREQYLFNMYIWCTVYIYMLYYILFYYILLYYII